MASGRRNDEMHSFVYYTPTSLQFTTAQIDRLMFNREKTHTDTQNKNTMNRLVYVEQGNGDGRITYSRYRFFVLLTLYIYLQF